MSSCTPCIANLKEKIQEWLNWDKNEETCAIIRHLVKENNQNELAKLLMTRLTFGTAGLRGKMSAGYSCINDLVIVQTGQGILKYFETKDKKLLSANGIVIGYDGRYNSKKWAQITAAIFLHAGYHVKLFGEVVPTPFIPYSVKKFGCVSGIMITASHNPKEDNGYKVYAANASQIIPPTDKEIQTSILANLIPLETSWDISILENSNLLSDPLEETLAGYAKVINDSILSAYKTINQKSGLLFTYTAMHGVGYKYIKKVLTEIGVKFIAVPEQKDPHPDFPTVKFPNPEEGKSSLDLSFRTANENNSCVIIANDPDADRLAVAELIDLSKREWKVFTGNELGALFGWWMLNTYKQKSLNAPLSNVYMICSTVSSMILKTMSKKEGFNFIDTLTGFKWIGNKTLELKKEGKEVILGYEEAIGFMCSSEVVDKDGISAACQLTTMASYLYSNNETLNSKLADIYSTYGYHMTNNSYYICHEPKTIKKIFDRLRNYSGKDTYPSNILNGKYVVTGVRDLTTGYDNIQPDNRAILPVSADSQMITFNFANGLVCTLRTSGTEPKIKYYSELCADPEIKDRSAIENTLAEMMDAICQEFLQPQENSLIARSG